MLYASIHIPHLLIPPLVTVEHLRDSGELEAHEPTGHASVSRSQSVPKGAVELVVAGVPLLLRADVVADDRLVGAGGEGLLDGGRRVGVDLAVPQEEHLALQILLVTIKPNNQTKLLLNQEEHLGLQL